MDEHGLGYIFHSVHHVLHAPGDQVDGVGAGDTGKQDIIGPAVHVSSIKFIELTFEECPILIGFQVYLCELSNPDLVWNS